MEKIYMEENNQNQRQKKNHMLGFSVVLSFSVAIFAVFSLVSFGLAAFTNHGGVSYAAPVVGDTFTFTAAKKNDAKLIVMANNDSGTYQVPIYLANNDYSTPVFCVEHTANTNDGDTYKKQEVIEDYGLLYLLNNSYANGVSVTNAGEGTGTAAEDVKYVEAWVTQTAIWRYLYEKDPSAKTDSTSPNYMSPQQISLIDAATTLTFGNTDDAQSIRTIYAGGGEKALHEYVSDLVNVAMSVRNAKQLSVLIDSNNPASVAEDKSFYESPVVTVSDNPFGGLNTFDVSVSGVEGAYLVDEDGNTVGTNLSAGTKFKVRIPANKVNGSETIDVKVNVLGHFNTLTGNYYTSASGDYQKVVTVTGATSDVSAGASFQIIPTPATGMNVAQTIYFIGLIVLLCGVGIVYANAKPVENKQ